MANLKHGGIQTQAFMRPVFTLPISYLPSILFTNIAVMW